MSVEVTYEDRLRRTLSELEAEREAFRKKASLVDLLEVTALAASAATCVMGLLQFLLDRICLRLGWQLGEVLLPSDDGSLELRHASIVYCEDEDRFSPFLKASQVLTFHRGQDLPGRVWACGEPKWIEDLVTGGECTRIRQANLCGIVSGLAWPVTRGRTVIAIIEMYSDRLQPVDATLMRTLSKVGAQLGRVVERQKADDKLRQAMCDLEKRVESRTLELQFTNQQLQDKISDYARSEKVKDDLVSTVSHELRTPLASLRGFTELMLSRQFPAERQAQFLGIIHKESIRLTKLINDFLDVQRLESGSVVFNLEALNLEALLEDAITLFNTGNVEGRIRLSIEPGLPLVQIDADRIRQVLANLINNAVKFSPNGGEIALGAVRDGNWVTVFVSDYGVGMEGAVIGRLFEKFFRADSADTRSLGGTGLGLSLVKQIVEAHKGQVWAESRPGEGTVAFVNLPVADEAKDSSESRRVGLIDVLLVEDDPAISQLLTQHLEDANLTVLATGNADEALSWLRHTETRLVLLDTHLSGEMDGWDVVNAMKRDPFLRFIPVANISASEVRVGGILLEGCMILPLPATPEGLLSILRQTLGRKLSGKVLLGVSGDAIARQMSSWLAQFGSFEVQQADSVAAILEEIDRGIPNILIMEMQIGAKSSMDVIHSLRVNRAASNLPVVILGNREIQPQEEAFLIRRQVHLLRKDMHTPAEIVEKVQMLLLKESHTKPIAATGQTDLACMKY